MKKKPDIFGLELKLSYFPLSELAVWKIPEELLYFIKEYVNWINLGLHKKSTTKINIMFCINLLGTTINKTLL